jgi:hypothetical protein
MMQDFVIGCNMSVIDRPLSWEYKTTFVKVLQASFKVSKSMAGGGKYILKL